MQKNNQLKTMLKTLPLALSLLTATHTFAEETPVKHFSGIKPTSLEQAQELFNTHNAEVAGILARSELAPAELHKIHELTYTIENALAFIQQDLNILAAQLETLHKASESGQTNAAVKAGKTYLENANRVIAQ